ncbi:hypothetical protein [Halomicrococcus gelatinilyticus]|uniref:hypothetical protein n=1 Tax=Halomicrococcus gelatinilyticus TaxID=1702103 RepID=UPI002E1332E4
MTRFSAATPTERQKLFADAVLAHRERASAFCTMQATPPDAGETGEGDGGGATGDDADDADDAAESFPPWVQFGERTLNLDCTDAELDRLKDLVGEFPAFKIEQLESPEEAEGTNVRISAKADANRIAQFVERTFREVYDRPEGYVAWVTEV